jgi:hypothetical protein
VSRDVARREARRAVEVRWTRSAFASRAAIDPGTLGDFLDGKRWPQGGNRAKIERALGWPIGAIADMADGVPVDEALGSAGEPTVTPRKPQPPTEERGSSVGSDPQDGNSLRFLRPEGLTDSQWDELRRQQADYWEYLVNKAAQQR